MSEDTVEPTVFIIDDHEAFRDSVKELVSSVGLAAATFRSAQEFLDMFDPARLLRSTYARYPWSPG